jgi:chlorite dismutase
MKLEVWTSLYVCDLELENHVQQDIDQLLEFFSCPVPALASGGKNLRMRIMIQDAKEHMFWAHCSSFKELQHASRLVKEYTDSLYGG